MLEKPKEANKYHTNKKHGCTPMPPSPWPCAATQRGRAKAAAVSSSSSSFAAARRPEAVGLQTHSRLSKGFTRGSYVHTE